GQKVLESGELHLEHGLPRAGTLAENVEDESSTVGHPRAEDTLQVALLAGGEIVVEYGQLVSENRPPISQFPSLALADKGGGVGMVAPLNDGVGHLEAGALCKARQLVQRFLHRPTATARPLQPYEDCYGLPLVVAVAAPCLCP